MSVVDYMSTCSSQILVTFILTSFVWLVLVLVLFCKYQSLKNDIQTVKSYAQQLNLSPQTLSNSTRTDQGVKHHPRELNNPDSNNQNDNLNDRNHKPKHPSSKDKPSSITVLSTQLKIGSANINNKGGTNSNDSINNSVTTSIHHAMSKDDESSLADLYRIIQAKTRNNNIYNNQDNDIGNNNNNNNNDNDDDIEYFGSSASQNFERPKLNIATGINESHSTEFEQNYGNYNNYNGSGKIIEAYVDKNGKVIIRDGRNPENTKEFRYDQNSIEHGTSRQERLFYEFLNEASKMSVTDYGSYNGKDGNNNNNNKKRRSFTSPNLLPTYSNSNYTNYNFNYNNKIALTTKTSNETNSQIRSRHGHGNGNGTGHGHGNNSTNTLSVVCKPVTHHAHTNTNTHTNTFIIHHMFDSNLDLSTLLPQSTIDEHEIDNEHDNENDNEFSQSNNFIIVNTPDIDGDDDDHDDHEETMEKQLTKEISSSILGKFAIGKLVDRARGRSPTPVHSPTTETISHTNTVSKNGQIAPSILRSVSLEHDTDNSKKNKNKNNNNNNNNNKNSNNSGWNWKKTNTIHGGMSVDIDRMDQDIDSKRSISTVIVKQTTKQKKQRKQNTVDFGQDNNHNNHYHSGKNKKHLRTRAQTRQGVGVRFLPTLTNLASEDEDEEEENLDDSANSSDNNNNNNNNNNAQEEILKQHSNIIAKIDKTGYNMYDNDNVNVNVCNDSNNQRKKKTKSKWQTTSLPHDVAPVIIEYDNDTHESVYDS